MKSGHAAWQEAVVPTVTPPRADPADLYVRSRARWARSRNEIEAEIRERQACVNRTPTEALHDWE